MADDGTTGPAGRWHSAPAGVGRTRIQPGHDAGGDLAAWRARQAVQAEQRKSIRVGLLLIGPVFFIALLALTADHWPTGKYHERAEDVDAWARGLLAIALLLVSAQLVTVVLVLEHKVGSRGEPWHGLRLTLVWVGRLVVVFGVLLAVVVNWPDPDIAPSWWNTLDDWDVVAVAAGGAEAFAALCLATMWWRTRSFDPTPDALTPILAPNRLVRAGRGR